LLEPLPLGLVAFVLFSQGFLFQARFIEFFLELVKVDLGENFLDHFLLTEHVGHQTDYNRLIKGGKVRVIFLIIIFIL
jgi:hypothetical protein